MMSESDYTLIEQYLKGELAEGELLEFEKRLVTEKQLANELALAKDMGAFVENRSRKNAALETAKSMSKKYRQNEAAKVIPIFRKRKFLLRILAGVASIFLILFFANIISKNPYDEFFQYEKIAGEQHDGETDLINAIDNFNEKKYKAALPSFEKISDKTFLKFPEYELAKGICYLELEKYEKATQTFLHILETQKLHKNEANWYLALTALRQKDFTTCRNFLSKIESQSIYADDAERLQKAIVAE